MSVDNEGHIWFIQRPWTVNGRELAAVEGEASCCRPAPPVIELDAMGNVVQAWPELREFRAEPGTAAGQGRQVGRQGETLWEAVDGPGYGEWGRREHTVYVDHNDFVWITLDDSHVIYKFTRSGEHVLTIGEEGMTSGSNHTGHPRPAGRARRGPGDERDFRGRRLHEQANHRVRRWNGTISAALGRVREPAGGHPARLRPEWGAAPAVRGARARHRPLIRWVHLRVGSPGGTAYRSSSGTGRSWRRPSCLRRLLTLEVRTAWRFPKDPNQQWVFVNDGSNNKIWILRRSDLEVVGSFASYGRNGGQVVSAHSIAVDQQNNIYVGETRGRRVQKFALRGM